MSRKIQETSFWFSKSVPNESDSNLLEGISASLRDYRGIVLKKAHAKEPFELDDSPSHANPMRRMDDQNLPIGLRGLKDMSCLSCLFQALMNLPLFRYQLLSSINNLENKEWGSIYEILDPKSPFDDIHSELIRVSAGMALSKRPFISCVSSSLAFLSFREQFNLGIPTSIEECWAFLCHSLSSTISDFHLYSHILLQSDQLLGISITDLNDIHQSITNISLQNQSFLSKKKGIFSFFSSKGLEGCPVDIIYLDRYLESNYSIVEPILKEMARIDVHLNSHHQILNQIIYRDLPLVQDSIEFVEGNLKMDGYSQNLMGHLLSLSSSINNRREDLESKISSLTCKRDLLFSSERLQQNPIWLYAVFKIDTTSNETVVYLKKKNVWFLFEGKDVYISSMDEIRVDKRKITCLWYTTEESRVSVYTDELIPYKLKKLIDSDNQVFEEEVAISLLAVERSN